MALSKKKTPCEPDAFVSDAMIRAGKVVLLGLIDKQWPEFVVDQVYRAMLAAKRDPSEVDTYEGIYGCTGRGSEPVREPRRKARQKA